MERNDKSYRSMFTQFVWVFSGMKRVLYGIPHPIWNFAPFIFLEGVECWLLSSVDVVGLEGYFVDVRMCVMGVEALVCRCCPAHSACHFQRLRVSATVTRSSLIFGKVGSQRLW